MDTTFISIHTLDPEARILYSSDSVIDILGYTPDEIVNRSAWEFFHEEELPYARKFHQKKVLMDKAAVLAYCRVKDRDGRWVGCECCFTIVYDVIVVCTSIYKKTVKSDKRAVEAPIVRRIFASSPQDPRYHMLSHLSDRFSQSAKEQLHEPRAALFLNRFTRTLTIMYATGGVEDIIGIPAETMRGRSFYYCIAENCLPDAVKCLENAKSNDSIAYLRFWYRDPRQDDEPEPDNDSDEEMTVESSMDDYEDDANPPGAASTAVNNQANTSTGRSPNRLNPDVTMDDAKGDYRTSSDESTNKADTHEAIFGQAGMAESSTSSIGASPERERYLQHSQPSEPVELEAVISCASDGLVVCLRKARPMVPHPTHRPAKPTYEKGLYAAPWADEPILPRVLDRPGAGFGAAFAPALGPQGARKPPHSPPQPAGPNRTDYMNAIREQAIFAWALTGINGSLSDFSRGKPVGGSLPSDGLQVWASDPRQSGTAGAHENEGTAAAHDRTLETNLANASIPQTPASGQADGTVTDATATGVGVTASSHPADGKPHAR